jgi:hypothetical protein
MNRVSQISPVTDVEVARLVRPGTFADLANEITGIHPASDAAPARARGGRARRRRMRMRLLIGVPVAAALAIAGLIATSAGAPGQRVGPISVGPPRAQAAVLSITRHGRYLDVIVKNPVADPKKYRAEFARYHLHISMQLVPASPSIVGSLVYDSESAGSGSQLKVITARGKCFTGGGGNVCPVGIRVPIHYRGTATLVFGRAARPGEQYESSAPATARGEAMHGLHFVGKTVAAVLGMLAERHVTVPQWRVQNRHCYTGSRRTVPSSWYVYDAVPWAPGQVLLWASKTWPVPGCQQPPAGTPVATPSPTASGSAAG